MSTFAEDRARVDAIAEKTGKPHLYVHRHGRNPEWLWAGRAEGPGAGEAIWDFCVHLDEVCGYES